MKTPEIIVIDSVGVTWIGTETSLHPADFNDISVNLGELEVTFGPCKIYRSESSDEAACTVVVTQYEELELWCCDMHHVATNYGEWSLGELRELIRKHLAEKHKE